MVTVVGTLRRMRLLAIIAAAVAIASASAGALAAGPGGAQTPKLRVGPRSGQPSTSFVVHFNAPVATGRSGSMTYRYQLDAQGPAASSGCVTTAELAPRAQFAGQAMAVKLNPAHLGGSWCSGIYTGKVIETAAPACGPPVAGPAKRLLIMCPMFIEVARTVGTLQLPRRLTGQLADSLNGPPRSDNSNRAPGQGSFESCKRCAHPLRREGRVTQVGASGPCPHTPGRARRAAVSHRICRRRRVSIRRRMEFELPDGTKLDLADGATGADAAAAIGAGLARAALAVKVDGDDARPRAAAAAGANGAAAQARDHHRPQRRRRARADPPRHRARAGGGGDGAVSGRQDLDRAADRERLLLRLRLPRRRHAERRRLRARSRRRCASTSRPTSRSCARTSASATARERFAAEHQDYKVELIDDLVREPSGRRDRLALHQRAVHRPVPRSALSERRSGSRRSSSSRSPARTGAATATGRC